MRIEKPINDEIYEELPDDPFDDSITTVCFTGHRNIPENVKPLLSQLLPQILDGLYLRGARIFKAGGAIGFDTMAAQAVVDLKARTNDKDIKLHLCLAAPDQSKKFNQFDSIIYRMVFDIADSYSYEAEKCSSSAYMSRNRRLLEGSDVCVAYCTMQKGGTYYTCTKALTGGIEFINLADFIDPD